MEVIIFLQNGCDCSLYDGVALTRRRQRKSILLFLLFPISGLIRS